MHTVFIHPAAIGWTRWGILSSFVMLILLWPSSSFSAMPNYMRVSPLAETGVDITRMEQIRGQIARGHYTRPCQKNEHDERSWHMLVSDEHGCHYDHHHGDNPNLVNDIFGAPGAWFGRANQSISYPWQTFKVPTDAPAYITAEDADAVQGKMENQHAHEGYVWVVRTNQPCVSDNKPAQYCITDFRVQMHSMTFAAGAKERWHSASLEARLCKNPDKPESCGIIRTGGWVDHGKLYNTAGVDNLRCNEEVGEGHITLEGDTQFWPLFKNDDARRCHPVLTKNLTTKAPALNDNDAKAEWWARGGPDFQFQLKVYDPIGNIIEDAPSSGNVRMHLHCRTDDPDCRYNQSIISATLGHALRVPWALSTPELRNKKRFIYKLDSDEDGVTDITLGKRVYITRYGAWNPTCRKPGLDCVPVVYDNIVLNQSPDKSMRFTEGSYRHYSCEDCTRVDHDLTPKGQVSWISWFHRYRDQPANTTELAAMEREMLKTQKLGILCGEKNARLFVRSKGKTMAEIGCMTTSGDRITKPAPYSTIENITLAQGNSLTASCIHKRLEVRLPGGGKARNKAQLICR